MSTYSDIKTLVINTLQLTIPDSEISEDTALIGNIPEFDSMAVVSIITAIEENYGFEVDDDEIDAEVFETIGSLVEFVDLKLRS